MAEAPLPSPARRFRWRAFADAWNGLRVVLRTQPNARFHGYTAGVAVGFGVGLRIPWPEWALLVLAIAGVWVAELFNTTVEWVVDLASPEYRELAGWAKDAAAAAVLVAAGGAGVVGALIFLPRIWTLVFGWLGG